MVWLSSLLVQFCYCAACSELGEIIAVSDAKFVLFLPPVVFGNVWCQHLSPGAVKSQNIETVLVSEGYSLVAKQLLVLLLVSLKTSSLLVLCSSMSSKGTSVCCFLQAPFYGFPMLEGGWLYQAPHFYCC